MGGEFGQAREWSEERSLDWELLSDPLHGGIKTLVGDLNRVYREHPGAVDAGQHARGLLLDRRERRGRQRAELPAPRVDADGNPTVLACVANFSGGPRDDYRVGLPFAGRWREVLNTDAESYGGSGVGNLGAVEAEPQMWHGRPASAALRLPPSGVLWLAPGEAVVDAIGAEQAARHRAGGAGGAGSRRWSWATRRPRRHRAGIPQGERLADDARADQRRRHGRWCRPAYAVDDTDTVTDDEPRHRHRGRGPGRRRGRPGAPAADAEPAGRTGGRTSRGGTAGRGRCGPSARPGAAMPRRALDADPTRGRRRVRRGRALGTELDRRREQCSSSGGRVSHVTERPSPWGHLRSRRYAVGPDRLDRTTTIRGASRSTHPASRRFDRDAHGETLPGVRRHRRAREPQDRSPAGRSASGDLDLALVPVGRTSRSTPARSLTIATAGLGPARPGRARRRRRAALRPHATGRRRRRGRPPPPPSRTRRRQQHPQ